MHPPSAIDWSPWATEAFSRAHARRRPVLLSIVASWSAACAAMDAEVFDHPRVAALARDRVVPVRVDADRRPDLADRYGAGGWPTTLLLTPAGDPICGGTYVDAEQLAATIDEVADRLAREPDEIRRLALEARRARREEARATAASAEAPRHSAAEGDASGETASPLISPLAPSDPLLLVHGGGEGVRGGEGVDSSPATLEAIASVILDAYDAQHSGFAFGPDGAKFPLAAPLAFALHRAQQAQDEPLLAVVTTTLDRMGWGGLSDDESGAFHRACAHADWTSPDPAHLLDVQADMLRLYVEAWSITGVERYRDRARAVWGYVDRTLHDREHGGFFHSERDGRVDRILLTDANARMIRALLVASLLLDDVEYAKAAARAAERLLPAVYGRGAGVAHVFDTHPRVRGLLTDQVHASAALLDLYDVTADRVYLDLADELMRSSLRKLSSGADAGALVDRLPSSAGAGDVGLLAEPLHPFALNVEAARVLGRLAHETDAAHASHAEFAARAAALRGWLAARWRREGLTGAEFGLLLLGDDAGDDSGDPRA